MFNSTVVLMLELEEMIKWPLAGKEFNSKGWSFNKLKVHINVRIFKHPMNLVSLPAAKKNASENVIC